MTTDEATAFCESRTNPQQALTIDTWTTAEKTERYQISYWTWIDLKHKFRVSVLAHTFEGAAALALESENRMRVENKMSMVSK